MRSRLLALIGLLLGTAVALLWAAPGASAHASLVASDPREGQTLEELPATVSFEFSEAMSEPAYVVVTGPDGSSVVSGHPEVNGAIVSQALDGSDAPGTYTMAYRAVSEDGHPVSGQITFTVAGAASESASPSPSASPSASGSPGSSARASATPPSASPAPSAPAAADDEGFWEQRGLQVGGAALLLVAAGGAWILARRTP